MYLTDYLTNLKMTFKKGDVRPVLAGRKSKIKTPLATEMSRKTIAHALEGHSFKIKMALDLSLIHI